MEEILKPLFPEAFEDNKVFCRVGCLLNRIGHDGNLYALVKSNGAIKLITINGSHEWTSTFPLRVSELRNQDYLTYSEFQRFMGSYAKEFRRINLTNQQINAHAV